MSEPQWRAMVPADLPAVKALADRIHPGLVERIEIFADRLAVFPEGSRVLAGEHGVILGYAVTHPAKLFAPPPLDHVLGRVPADADSYYIHDVVVVPELRGAGHAQRGVADVLRVADRHPATALVSVYGTMPFWSRFGFVDATARMSPGRLGYYGDGARYMVRRTPD